jgi:hypothetical protein
MYTVIVTTSGYVESSQMSHIIWRATDQGEYDLTDPLSAFKSLADDLFQHYLDNCQKLSGSKKCHKYKSSYKDSIFCQVCGDRLRADHEAASDFFEFNNYVRRFSHCTANDFGDDLDRWWPWDGISALLNADRKDVIYVSENFESLATKVVTSPYLTDKEKLLLKQYQDDLYKVKARFNEATKLMEIITDYD